MKDRILSLREVDTARRNLDMIDARLGYEAPRTLLSDTDLTSNIMSLSEVDRVARNIDMVDACRSTSYTRPTLEGLKVRPATPILDFIELVFCGGIAVAFVIYLINYFIKFVL